MKFNPFQILLFIGMVINLIIGCTGSPIGDEEIKDKRKIQGVVALDDGANPEGIIVWLKNKDILTETDDKGEFSLLLPKLTIQQSERGTIEHDTLYFYVANYTIVTAVVRIVEGEFRFLEADLDKEGNVRGPIELKRFMHIKTEITKSFVENDYSDTIDVNLKLQADFGCASVTNPRINETDSQRTNENASPVDTLGAIIFRNVASKQIKIHLSDPNASNNERLIACNDFPVIRSLRFTLADVSLLPGKYDVIPYILVDPENVPPQLIRKIGQQVNELNANYLQKPMRRDDALFEIR